MNRVCVFCGSSLGTSPHYTAAAQRIGAILAHRQITLVYGGGNVGLIGVLANAVLGAGGDVIGVIPQALADLEVAHTGLPDLRIVGSMHERKALMADLSDGFIALPGGIGTLEELCEILTWAQLGMHAKPCGVLNVQGYFDHLTTFLDHTVRERFFRAEHRAMLLIEDDPDTLLNRFDAYRPPQLEKWINRRST
ncbi:MAG: TIGR00730 family Rossman fold protein [Candidatus Binatia bacterium]